MVAVGIPKETLIKRPDIFQARLEAIAQSEAIGAIKANFFLPFPFQAPLYDCQYYWQSFTG